MSSVAKADIRAARDLVHRNVAWIDTLGKHFAAQGNPNITLGPQGVQGLKADLVNVVEKLNAMLEGNSPSAPPPAHPGEPAEGG